MREPYPVEKISIIAITRNGIKIASLIQKMYPGSIIHAPAKLRTDDDVEWFQETTAAKMGSLFRSSNALVCVFSLGAVIRLITPHLKSKKTDPAVLVIDDKANFVISALSGHIGGANQLTTDIAEKLGAAAVITTAADVNKTIPVDMIGRDLGWRIEDDSDVTRVSAMMVNEEKIALFQDAGSEDWWRGPLPKNVTRYHKMRELAESDSQGHLIISDRDLGGDIPKNTILYRPRSLIVGVGLHHDTTQKKIESGIQKTLQASGLHIGCIAGVATVRKRADADGLAQYCKRNDIPIKYVDRDELAGIRTPNPSRIVEAFEGTPSVSEAAAILVSGGRLIVEKQKFPPDLTVAVARVKA